MSTYTSSELNEQLDDLRKVLAIAEDYGARDAASSLGLNSLRIREESLVSELKAAQMAELGVAVEVAIDGDPVREHAVSISFFGQLLTIIQNLTNAVAQVQANAQTARGQIKDNLILRNRFELAHTFPSSFGAALRLPVEKQGALSFEFESAADVVCKLFEGQDLDTETVDFLSSSRVRAHYAALVDLIGKQGASVVFRTLKQPQGSKISAQQARDRSDWLDLLKTTSETISVEGSLVGGSIETKKFEIKIDTGEIYKGRVVDDAISKMSELNLGAQVKAVLEVATSTHEEASLERVTYRLLDIGRA